MFYREALTKLWFVSSVDSMFTIGDRHCQKLAVCPKKLNQQIRFCLEVASFPVLPQRAGEKAWILPFAHALNRHGISRRPHTIDILLFTCDGKTDATHYIVRKFTMAAYAM